MHQETWTRDGEKVDGVIPDPVEEKVDGVIPERVFVPSFRYLGCGFTLPCKSSAESGGKKREVLTSEAIKQEVDSEMEWALCIFVSLLQNTIEGTNMTCVNTKTAQ